MDVDRKSEASKIRLTDSFGDVVQVLARSSIHREVDVCSDVMSFLVDVELRSSKNTNITTIGILLAKILDAKHPVIAIRLPLVKVIDIDVEVVAIPFNDVDVLYHFVCLQSIWFGFIFLIDIYIISYT